MRGEIQPRKNWYLSSEFYSIYSIFYQVFDYSERYVHSSFIQYLVFMPRGYFYGFFIQCSNRSSFFNISQGSIQLFIIPVINLVLISCSLFTPFTYLDQLIIIHTILSRSAVHYTHHYFISISCSLFKLFLSWSTVHYSHHLFNLDQLHLIYPDQLTIILSWSDVHYSNQVYFLFVCSLGRVIYPEMTCAPVSVCLCAVGSAWGPYTLSVSNRDRYSSIHNSVTSCEQYHWNLNEQR